MTWVRTSDTFADRPVWDQLGAEALALHMAALGYCNRHVTEQEARGELRPRTVRRLFPLDDPLTVADGLVEHGVWRRDGEVYVVVADLDEQPEAEEVEVARRQNRFRQNRRRKHLKGDHSDCDPTRCHALLSRDKTRDVSRDVTRESRTPPSRPSPSRPLGRDEGEGETTERADFGLPAYAVDSVVSMEFEEDEALAALLDQEGAR